jgi:hypothetical protein
MCFKIHTKAKKNTLLAPTMNWLRHVVSHIHITTDDHIQLKFDIYVLTFKLDKSARNTFTIGWFLPTLVEIDQIILILWMGNQETPFEL